MHRRGRVLLVTFLAVLGSLLTAASAEADCGLPGPPMWIDFGDGSVQFRNQLFTHPGLIIATVGLNQPAMYRAAGAQTVYWEMGLDRLIGTPTSPVDPSTVAQVAANEVATAQASSACATPTIALNELLSAATGATAANSTYRNDVLSLLTDMTNDGAHPYLLVPGSFITTGAAADFYRRASIVAHLMPEVYFNGRTLSAEGPLLASRTLRIGFRGELAKLTAIGIPTSRLALVLGFQSAIGTLGREGLQPTAAWLEIVKLQALAARQVASELSIDSVWSWGWGTFGPQSVDPDKPLAACTYLWTRSPTLCDAPTLVGPSLDTDVTEGQITLAPGVQCSFGTSDIKADAIDQLAPLGPGADWVMSALFERAVLAQTGRPTPAEVIAAQRYVIATTFAGRRSAYQRALARAHSTSTVANGVLADELLRARAEAALPVAAPTAAAIAAYARSHAGMRVRMVRATPAAPWLGGRATGLALGASAPAAVFRLARGTSATIHAADGAHRVTAVGRTLPLRKVSRGVARASIAALLTATARRAAFPAWLATQEAAALAQMTCLADELPQARDVRLTPWLPFLTLGT